MFTVPVYSKWCDSLALIILDKFHVLLADLLLPNHMIRLQYHEVFPDSPPLGSKLSGQYCYFLYTEYANRYWHQNISGVMNLSQHWKNWIEIENRLYFDKKGRYFVTLASAEWHHRCCA